MLRLKKGIVKIGVQSDPTFFIEKSVHSNPPPPLPYTSRKKDMLLYEPRALAINMCVVHYGAN